MGYVHLIVYIFRGVSSVIVHGACLLELYAAGLAGVNRQRIGQCWETSFKLVGLRPGEGSDNTPVTAPLACMMRAPQATS